MQRSLIRLGALLVLLICLWGHVAELFDHWDHTLETGNDAEYSLVIVVILAGATVVGLGRTMLLLRQRSGVSKFVSSVIGKVQSLLAAPVQLTPSPPPAPLRI